MKKICKVFFLIGTLLMCVQAFGQASQSKFTPSGATLPMSEQNGINVTYQTGTLGEKSAICLGLKNTSQAAETFVLTLKDANGKAVFTSKPMHLEVGQSLDKGAINNRMVFAIATGMKAADYKVEIALKN